jgi:hypothetical protein
MLPSRSRLRGWNPDSLSPAASALSGAGRSVYAAVRGLDDECDRMPEARAWSGQSHDAATAMFRRAAQQNSQFTHYTEGVATALKKGSGSIGGARTSLLNHADEVDRGELSVSDMWVVLIKPARVSAEKAASLQAQAKAEQAEINGYWSQSEMPTTERRKWCRPPPRTSASPFQDRTILEVWTRPRDWQDLPTKSPIRCHLKGSSSRASFATTTWRTNGTSGIGSLDLPLVRTQTRDVFFQP